MVNAAGSLPVVFASDAKSSRFESWLYPQSNNTKGKRT